ncbi:hypothetical protein L596_024297 [Steinernema carpocapsae]|uniref:Uncharacterized protein n=1 Tax=Steinernema carpocapsae TaxID=34508 RepID=A0A4U5MGC1_STECR|nr:hypothetical protein L596_024297 [Steinernema carpocapsae]
MDVLRLRNYKFRIANEKMQHSDNSYFGQWRISDILSGDHVSPMNPESTVAVEIDVFVKDITNKLHLANNKKSSNPGLEFIWKDEERRSAKRGEKVPTELSQEDMKPHFVSEHEMKDLETLRRVLELGTPAGTPASQDERHLNDSFKDLSQALNETFDDIFNCANLTILDESLTEASFERRKEELEEEEDDEEDHNLPVNPPSEQLEENEEDSIMPFPDNLAALGPTDFRDLELEMEPRPISNISCFDMFQVSLKSDGEQSEAEEAKPKDDLLDWYNYFELEPEVEMPEMKQLACVREFLCNLLRLERFSEGG